MRALLSIRVVPFFTVAALAVAPSAFAANPTVGDCLSATETSLKLRTDHKLRAARVQALTCSSASCPAEVREECLHRMGELNAAVPTVVFTVKTAAGDELAAVNVTMDGEAVADHLDGSALSLDPGSHQFTFDVAGQPPLTKTVILHEGEKNRRETIVLGPVTVPIVAAPAPLPAPPAAPSSSGHGQRVAGFVVGGAGAAGIIVGSVFGGLTFSAWGSAHTACPTNKNCDAQAVSDRSSSVTDGTVSTAAFIVGGALLAGGVALYLLAPKDHEATVGLMLSPGALGFQGTF